MGDYLMIMPECPITRGVSQLCVSDFWVHPGTRTASSVFHWIASLFYLQSCYEPTPIELIRQLRQNGLSVSKIAELTGSTQGVVRRVVGKLNPTEVEEARQHQGETARQIDSLPISWSEKVARWKDQTGQSEATLWRVLKKHRQVDAG